MAGNETGHLAAAVQECGGLGLLYVVQMRPQAVKKAVSRRLNWRNATQLPNGKSSHKFQKRARQTHMVLYATDMILFAGWIWGLA
jgi:hypothetical protein